MPAPVLQLSSEVPVAVGTMIRSFLLTFVRCLQAAVPGLGHAVLALSTPRDPQLCLYSCHPSTTGSAARHQLQMSLKIQGLLCRCLCVR